MSEESESPQELRRLTDEIQRLRKERDGYREDLGDLRSSADENVSAQLRLLSVSLSKEIREDFFTMLRRGGTIAAILITVATAGGLWTVSGLIDRGVDKAVATAVEKREHELTKFRDDVIQTFVEFKLNSKESLQKIKEDAKHALEQIESEQKNVAEAGKQAQVEIRSRASSPATAESVSEGGTISIPLVVHVVYHTNLENISDAQINSQVTVLNDDFQARNDDLSKVPAPFKQFIGNAHIEFALAAIDPQGKPTSGITRTRTNRQSFGTDDSVKSKLKGGVDPWPVQTYLNVWICTLSGGLLRYAQFPEGPEATDGVVILNTAFGTTGTATAPFNKGRSLVGGIAEYLKLRHIWGDTADCTGTDFVADTPPQQLPNYGHPAFPHISCDNGPNGDMFMNFMDYVDDDAMFMFTKGQVDRMRETLKNQRSKLGKR